MASKNKLTIAQLCARVKRKILRSMVSIHKNTTFVGIVADDLAKLCVGLFKWSNRYHRLFLSEDQSIIGCVEKVLQEPRYASRNVFVERVRFQDPKSRSTLFGVNFDEFKGSYPGPGNRTTARQYVKHQVKNLRKKHGVHVLLLENINHLYKLPADESKYYWGLLSAILDSTSGRIYILATGDCKWTSRLVYKKLEVEHREAFPSYSIAPDLNDTKLRPFRKGSKK